MKYTKLLNLLIFSALLFSACTGGNAEKLQSGRGIVVPSGIVVSSHPEASSIGAEILRKGGNAVDAAVATEFALAVSFPFAGNIGGGGFMVIRLADGKTDVIDYREKAPALASRNMFLDSGGNVIPHLSTESHLASGVPGTVDGMLKVHSQYGKLPFREVIQPAIDLALKGFNLTKSQAEDLNANRRNFIDRNSGPTVFVKDSLWKEGDLLVQTDLGATLERIRDQGRDGFYSGKTATLITAEMQRGKGLISAEDLKNYRCSSRKALTGDYRGYHIITVPPPSSGGIIVMQLLGMIEPYQLRNQGFNSPATIHLIVEAERRAFADRAEFLGDPDFMKVPVSSLFDRNYLHERMVDFDPKKATSSEKIKPGSPSMESDQTTHYSVVDAYGNAVAATTTLNGAYGNSVVVEGAGFLMNNQMDDFSIKPGFPNMYGVIGGEVNSIAPGKKMLSSMTPVIVEKEGKLFLVAGSPGGSTIPTTVFQVITNIVDFGMDVQTAVDAGRFHHQWLPDEITYEKTRLDSAALDKLQLMGHRLEEVQSIGSVNAIMLMNDGRKSAGADRRGDNIACGY